MNYSKNNVIKRIEDKTSLETKLKVLFEMHDYKNWLNGEYFGDSKEITDMLLEEIKKHLSKHAPELDLKKILLYNQNEKI